MKFSVSSTHYHPILSPTPFQLTEAVPTFYKFKLWLVKTDINDPFLNFILLLAMENKHYFEKKWDCWNGREEIVMEYFSSIWFSGKTVHCTWERELEGELELFWWPNRSVVCSVREWMTDQTHSIHFGVMWFFYRIDC